MDILDKVPTHLVVYLRFERYGTGDYYVNAFDMTLIAGDEDGLIYDTLKLTPDTEGYGGWGESIDWNAAILEFIADHFGAAVTLVTHNLPDVLRYFQQSAPGVAARLARVSYIDLDAFMIIGNSFELLPHHIPARDVGSAMDAYENFMFFREVFASADRQPPLAFHEKVLLGAGGGSTRLKSAASAH